jgi:cell division protease FtsH
VDRVHRISIVPRGQALGYTLNLPEEDRYLKTREELIDYMTMLLGGRAAEQLVFGSITTGAADDLKRVADIAHAMVHDYAMGTWITSLRLNGERASDETRRVRDAEVRELADEAARAADAILDSHRPQLDDLASRLLRNEVLERSDIDEVMGSVPAVAPPRIGVTGLGLAAATAADPAPRPARRAGK